LSLAFFTSDARPKDFLALLLPIPVSADFSHSS
jgi:hypothetical protein